MKILTLSASALIALGLVMASPAQAQPKMPERTEMTIKVLVNKVDDKGQRAPYGGAAVLLDAMATPQMKIKTYTEKADEGGVATFKITAIKGGTYVPKVLSEGINTTGAAILPDGPEKSVKIDVFGKTADDSGLLVTEMRTIVEMTEGGLRFMQMWSFVNTTALTFDPSAAALQNDKYKDGLPIRLPFKASGAHARIMKGREAIGEGEVVEDRVLIKAPVPPMTEGQEPLTIQVIFGLDLDDPTLEYSQPIDYKVEGMQVILALQTHFKKAPTLNLTLDAPGFAEVGDNRDLKDLRQDMKFLVARDGHADPGGALIFTARGFPVHDPPARKVALGLAILILLGGIFIILRENKGKGARSNRAARIKALTNEREDLFDDLRDLEERYEDGEISDRVFDIEAAKVRERLALVLRRLDQEQAGDKAA